MLKHLTAIAFLAASTHAMAQADMTLDGLAKKEPAAFSQMVKGHNLPASSTCSFLTFRPDKLVG